MRCKFEIWNRYSHEYPFDELEKRVYFSDLEKMCDWIDNNVGGVCSGFGYEMTNSLPQNKTKEFIVFNTKFKTSIVKGV